jgi:hypothetical protein
MILSLQDRRDDLQLASAAARAAPHVDVEHALERPRPADVPRPRLHGLRVAPDLACGAGRRPPSSMSLLHHPRPQRRVGRQHPVVPDQVQPRLVAYRHLSLRDESNQVFRKLTLSGPSIGAICRF